MRSRSRCSRKVGVCALGKVEGRAKAGRQKQPGESSVVEAQHGLPEFAGMVRAGKACEGWWRWG